jgi:hypothetical protein
MKCDMSVALLAFVHFLLSPKAAGSGGLAGNSGTTTSIDAVLDVLEKRGVEFIENGVRLTKRPRR